MDKCSVMYTDGPCGYDADFLWDGRPWCEDCLAFEIGEEVSQGDRIPCKKCGLIRYGGQDLYDGMCWDCWVEEHLADNSLIRLHDPEPDKILLSFKFNPRTGEEEYVYAVNQEAVQMNESTLKQLYREYIQMLEDKQVES